RGARRRRDRHAGQRLRLHRHQRAGHADRPVHTGQLSAHRYASGPRAFLSGDDRGEVRGMRAKLALLVALSAVVLSGCGIGPGAAPTAVQVVVTRDFGSQVLQQAGGLKVAGQETVMSLLMRNYKVATKYGGGFVQSIDGLAGGQEGGEPVDW